jgi:HSP20 family protein
MIVRRMFNTPNLGWRSPFDELELLRNRMNTLSRTLSGETPFQRSAGVFPLINVTEDKDYYRVRAELPGLSAEDLDISITGNSLALSGERKISEEAKDAKYHRRERESGKFSRMIELPDHVEGEKVEAKMADGILTVVLPKAETAKPRQIKVK